MPACPGHFIGFCGTSFHAEPEQILAVHRLEKKKNHSARSQILTYHIFFLPLKGRMTCTDINSCDISLQFVVASSRSAPKDWLSQSWYPVTEDVDSVLLIFFFSVRLTTGTCFSYSNGPSPGQRKKDGGIKAKLSVSFAKNSLPVLPSLLCPKSAP